MKKVIITVLILSITSMIFGQRYYTQYQKNPAYNTFLQEHINELSISSTLMFVGYDGAPKYNRLNGDFGLKNENVGFNFEISQYKLADFNKTSIGLGYAYKLPMTNWSMGIDVITSLAKLNITNTNFAYANEYASMYDNNATPGVDVAAGIVYSGEKLIFSLAGKQMVVGTQDLNGFDQSLTTNLLLDFGYKPISTKSFGLIFNIGTDVSDLSLFKSSQSMPIHLDVIVDIMQSFQVGLRADYSEGMTLHINQQTKRFIWFLNQGFPFMMFGNGFSQDCLSTEIGFGIRFLANKKSGKDLPHLNDDNEEGGNI